ncbi:MAG: hypothetical protein ACRCWB_03925 [Enterovibrio sp.]
MNARQYKGTPYSMIVIPEGVSFGSIVTLKSGKESSDKTNKIISALAEKNDSKRVIDLADFNGENKNRENLIKQSVIQELLTGTTRLINV